MKAGPEIVTASGDAARWGDSGAMWLTGWPDGPPLVPRGDPAGATAAMLDRWRSASPGDPVSPGVAVLGERAAIAGLGRAGDTSCGGAARILPARTGRVVMSLARDSDIDLVPALVGSESPGPAWDAVAAWLTGRDAHDAVTWARTLGLPAAVVPTAPPAGGRSPVVAHRGAARAPLTRPPRVLDLTSLWAGPLAARLLGLAGADVVKVESRTRPDGARRGPAEFFDLMHTGHRSVALDLDDPTDRLTLRRLAEASDVVLEASRPRALRQLGLVAEDLVGAGVTWASVTAYGRDLDGGMRVGFGDDVAASAGLVAGPAARPVFCGDAIADPLSGVTTAAAVARALTTPHAWLLDVSMHDVCRVVAALPCPVDPGEPLEPRHPPACAPAPSLGADTDEVVRAWLA